MTNGPSEGRPRSRIGDNGSVESGRAHPIVQVGDPVLTKVCEPVAVFDETLSQLVADMFASMYAAEGVGLAANQIGVDAAVFVFDCPDADDVRHKGVVCNPVLQDLDTEARNLDEDQEGCLSVKGQYSPLARPDTAVVTGLDASGAPVRIDGTGLLARCLQHETDHLNGLLYIDRLTAKARRKVLQAWQDQQGQAKSL
jgi:peptide deformylase